jgi:hypothetical protein
MNDGNNLHSVLSAGSEYGVIVLGHFVSCRISFVSRKYKMNWRGLDCVFLLRVGKVVTRVFRMHI